MQKVFDLLVRCLEREGITDIFGAVLFFGWRRLVGRHLSIGSIDRPKRRNLIR